MRASFPFLSLVLATAFLFLSASALYLPGAVPNEFKDSEKVELKVGKLFSSKTQLPFEYYSLPFCKPSKIIDATDSFGEFLFGDRVANSLYNIRMLREVPNENVLCSMVCSPRVYSKSEMHQFRSKIKEEYHVELLLDDLPVSVAKEALIDGKWKTYYELGFPLGFAGDPAVYPGSQKGRYYVNNHLMFQIHYHKEGEEGSSRIVGFQVVPKSVSHFYDPMDSYPLHYSCPFKENAKLAPQSVDDTDEIVWTYEVQWVPSNVKWASRWDLYMKIGDSNIRWFSILNSLMVILFLSAAVAVVLVRTLRRDLARFQDQEDEDDFDSQSQGGWKHVAHEVFRTHPSYSMIAVFTGTGMQVLACGFLVLGFALLGFLSPANRGGLMSFLIGLFVLMGVVAGYVAAILFKLYDGTRWILHMFLVGTLFPGFLFGMLIILNFFVLSEHSSRAIPIQYLLKLAFMWFLISLPLVIAGWIYGYRREKPATPVQVHHIAREIPPQKWYLRSYASIPLSGLFPFSVFAIEMMFIMTSMWQEKIYHMFGILFIVFLILIIACIEIDIVMVYFTLCGEEYHWQWRSFLAPAMSSVYMFLFSVAYFYTRLQIVKFVSIVLYFGYMIMMCSFFFFLTGAVGHIASLVFVRKIYSVLKSD
eukprot:TRINITY_DN1888_c0_g1_i1.p1 TRINITY_DN1888_c0_g1~~TRINITY_DN1888_c0_g1_i1.p1  ORF type:complete len:645 (-),score=130.72 TRINITY_DN1888_c0_g1_i1:1528-3462(-)